MTALNELIEFSLPVWPGKEEVTPQPGDLTKFVANGYYCDENFFGEQENPFTRMPRSECVGGAICFDSDVYRKDKKAFITLMKALGMWDDKKFVAFTEERGNSHIFCAKQMRLVSDFTLKSVFNVIDREDLLPTQKITMPEAFWYFIQEETRGCDPPKNVSSGKLILTIIPPSIGVMVENSYYGIYRIWSRWPDINK